VESWACRLGKDPLVIKFIKWIISLVYMTPKFALVVVGHNTFGFFTITCDDDNEGWCVQAHPKCEKKPIP